MSIFSTTLPLLDFYGWVGNSITISTAISSRHYTIPDNP